MRWQFGSLMLGLCLLGGCQSEREERALLAQMLQVQTELHRVLTEVKDAATMRQAAEDLAALKTRSAQLAQQARRMRPPSAELQAEFAQRLQELQEKAVEEYARIEGLPGGPAFLRTALGEGSLPGAAP